jgi:hypothetical protein
MWLRVCQRPDVGRAKSCRRLPSGFRISSYTLAHVRSRGAAIINSNANNNNVNTSGDARD